MKIRASSDITLNLLVDTESQVWYYKLQDADLAFPEKPTEDIPEGWTETEPSYESGSTKKLYTCIKTLFSDGSYIYSEVSLSSSYEASKDAYNKATLAEITANDARNQAINGQKFLTNVYYYVSDSADTQSNGYWTTEVPVDYTDDDYIWTKTVFINGTTTYETKPMLIMNNSSSLDDYVLRIETPTNTEFINNVCTTLKAYVYKNGVQLTDKEINEIGVIKWLDEDTNTLIGMGNTYEVNITDSKSFVAILDCGTYLYNGMIYSPGTTYDAENKQIILGSEVIYDEENKQLIIIK